MVEYAFNNPIFWALALIFFSQLYHVADIFIKDQITAEQVRKLDKAKSKALKRIGR